jgi:RNA polymerase sigma-70 factor (ECF subfamily)
MGNTNTSTITGYRLPVSQSGSKIFGSRADECNVAARRIPSLADFESQAMPYMNDLLRTATRVLRDPSRAEDVVQDVFLHAWKSFDRIEPGTNCKPWLYRILFNTVNHHRRKWFRLRLFSENEEGFEQTPTWTPPLPEGLTDGEILAALDQVPVDFRTVVVLVDVDEFAYREVAGILQIPIGTVMSRLRRGRRLLRERLPDAAQAFSIGKSAAEGRN